MASLIAKLWTKISNKKALISIMLIGLDNSGKTSVLNYLASLSSSSSSSSSTTTTSFKTKISQRIIDLDDSDEELEVIYNESGINIMPTAGYNYERFQYKGATLTVLDFSGQNRYRNLWQEFYNSVDGIVFVIDSSDLIRLVVAKDELELMLNHSYFSTLEQINNNNNNNNNNKDNQSNNNFSSPSLAAASLQKQLTISQGKLIQSPLICGPLNSSTMSSSSSMLKNLTKLNTSSTTNNKSSSSNEQLKCRKKIPILILANKSDLANSVDIKVISKALNLDQLSINRHPWFIQATSVNLSQGIVEGFDWLVSQLTSVN